MTKAKAMLILCTVLLFSCKKESLSHEDHFFVDNDGSSMPVYVRGNLSSDVIVLFLHGGPGGNASQTTFLPSFQDLEKSYAMAYWDQRASGLSQGNPVKSTFTVNQFVEDLDYVIEALQIRYPKKEIFLFGHSWGGALGSAYLSTSNYQNKIQGFICMDSGHNLELGLPLSVLWVGNYANEQILANNNIEYWKKVKDWCTSEPDMTVPENYFMYVEYLKETDAYRHNNQEVNLGKVEAKDIFNSRMSLAALINGGYLAQNFNILALNLSTDMQNIIIPSIIIWGIHDGVNTLDMGYDAFHSLGTDSTQKKMVLLNNSAHEGYLEEPVLFISSIIEFVEEYK